jgi:hypothetical protein
MANGYITSVRHLEPHAITRKLCLLYYHQHRHQPTNVGHCHQWRSAALLFHTPTKYGSDRFRKIFTDHWERWWDYHREEIPADQQAYVQKMVEKMMGCRNPQGGYARYVCPECHEERIVPFSCKTRFCPSCGKVRTDEWVGACRRS